MVGGRRRHYISVIRVVWRRMNIVASFPGSGDSPLLFLLMLAPPLVASLSIGDIVIITCDVIQSILWAHRVGRSVCA